MRIILISFLLLFISGCSTSQHNLPPSPRDDYYRIPKPISCVPFARERSGIQIRGNAHTWWYNASANGYRQGQVPKVGAVFVLSKSSRLRYGHVSVVTRIVSPRIIEVTHSNWGRDRASRSIIYKRMRVEDLSAQGDWTRARFWNYELNQWGLPYEASGFIYPR